jgi:RNA polymerase sigma factor (sigma-70 family)
VSSGSLQDVVGYLRRTVAPAAGQGVADAELLDRFVRAQDQAAFELLVWRHGRMVLGLCRRVLRHGHDAEDAFQATFLALARRASSVGRRGTVAGWLYRVAYRTALAARERQAKRRLREQPLAGVPLAGRSDPAAEAAWREVRGILDAEVNRLADCYRLPFILCCFEGKTNAEAARELGCAVSTIESRLTRARRRLRASLARRGVTLSGGLVGLLLARTAEAVSLPAALITSTTHAASQFAVHQAAGVIAAEVAALTEGVLRAMLLTKLKVTAAVVLSVGLLSAAAGVAGLRAMAAGTDNGRPAASASAPQKAGSRAAAGPRPIEGGSVASVDPTHRTITLMATQAMPLPPELLQHLTASPLGTSVRAPLEWHQTNYRLAPNVRVVIDGKDARLSDLTARTPVKLIEADGLVTRIEAEGHLMQACFLRGLDVIKHVLTVNHYNNTYQYAYADGVRVTIDGRTHPLGDLRADMQLALKFSAVRQDGVVGIRATGPTVECTLKSVDAARHTVTVRLTKEHLTARDVRVDWAAKIEVAGKPVGFGELKPGMPVSLQMSADPEQSLVLGIRARAIDRSAGVWHHPRPPDFRPDHGGAA